MWIASYLDAFKPGEAKKAETRPSSTILEFRNVGQVK